MLILAATPSISTLTVVARTASAGFIHGAFTTLGIVLGDALFILLAVFGLSLLAEHMAELFDVLKYLGGAYLIWLGSALFKTKPLEQGISRTTRSSLAASFMAGLLITLGDQKAILFYLVLFPAFFNLSALSYADAGVIILIAGAAIGIAKLSYALMVRQAGVTINKPLVIRSINYAAGTVMVFVGLYLLVIA